MLDDRSDEVAESLLDLTEQKDRVSSAKEVVAFATKALEKNLEDVDKEMPMIEVVQYPHRTTLLHIQMQWRLNTYLFLLIEQTS